MNLKEIIKEKVERDLSFLKRIKICSSNYDDFISTNLLPYLFYTNTTDFKYRVIPIFLSKKSNIILLPLFYSLSLFKVYAERYLKFQKFQKFQPDDGSPIRIVDKDGTIGKIVSLDFIAQELIVINGKGIKNFYSFDDIDFLEYKNKPLAYYAKSSIIFDTVKSYRKTVKISQNPLELIELMSDSIFNNQYIDAGAVFFTQELSLLRDDFYRDIKINDSSFFNVIPSSRLDFKMGKIFSTRLGNSRIKNGKQFNLIKEFLVFTHLENYDAYFDIKKNKNWINTIIFDFTKDTKYLDNVLNAIDEIYYDPLSNGDLKDIYLLFNEKDLNNYQSILNRGIGNAPFLLNSEQKKKFIGNPFLKDTALIECSTIDLTSEFQNSISFARKLCSQIHLINLLDNLLFPLFDIRNRFHSFFDPKSLAIKIEEFEKSIVKIQKDWFYSSEYRQGFEVLFTLISKLNENLLKSKNSYISDLIDDKESSVCIVSYNENIDDISYLQQISDFDLTFFDLKELKNPIVEFEKFDVVIILNLNKELAYVCNLNPFKNKLLLLLNKNELKFYNNIKNSRLINSLSHETKLADVLNIELTVEPQIVSKEIPTIEEINNPEFKLDDFIAKILKENKSNKIYTSYTRDLNPESILLVFNDGTAKTVNENNYFFIHKENIGTLTECHTQAKNLAINDIIFLLNHDANEFEKLIWQVAEDYPEIMRLLKLDLEWRRNIKDFIQRKFISIESFRSELSDNGYLIYSTQAIQTWINGDVYQPRNLNDLLIALSAMKVISEQKIEEIEKAIKTTKKLKTRLPHELQLRHIADLNDLEYYSDYEFPELSEKMYRFMDIKTISLIIK